MSFKRWIGLLGLLFFPVLTYGDDWPQWLGPNRDGYWREIGVLEKFPEGGPKILWRQKIGAGYAGASISNGKIFVGDRIIEDRNPLDASGFAKGQSKGKDRILCLDEKSGETLWKHEYESTYRVSYANGPRCTPTVDRDLVYSLGTMGELFCLKVSNGEVVWQKDFIKDCDAQLPVWGFSSHPLIDGENLICLVGGSGNRYVMAFDKKTGKEVWKALSISGDPGYAPPVIFQVGRMRQLIIWSPEAVHALDPLNGKKLWEIKWAIESALTAPTPRLVDKDKLFLTSFYNGSMLLKLDTEKPGASIVWKSKSKGGQAAVMPDRTLDLHSIMPTPFIVGDHIYGVCSYGELRCLKLDTGEREWMTHKPIVGKSERWGNAFLTPNGEKWFLFNELGELIIAKLSPKGYEEIDRAKILDPSNKMPGRPVVWTHPAYANKKMFVRNDKEIVAVSLEK